MLHGTCFVTSSTMLVKYHKQLGGDKLSHLQHLAIKCPIRCQHFNIKTSSQHTFFPDSVSSLPSDLGFIALSKGIATYFKICVLNVYKYNSLVGWYIYHVLASCKLPGVPHVSRAHDDVI